jgi:hypothetical protein
MNIYKTTDIRVVPYACEIWSRVLRTVRRRTAKADKVIWAYEEGSERKVK